MTSVMVMLLTSFVPGLSLNDAWICPSNSMLTRSAYLCVCVCVCV
jgi:hypothetical protein